MNQISNTKTWYCSNCRQLWDVDQDGCFFLHCVWDRMPCVPSSVLTSPFLTNWLWAFYDWCTYRTKSFLPSFLDDLPMGHDTYLSIKADPSRTMQIMTNSIILHYALFLLISLIRGNRGGSCCFSWGACLSDWMMLKLKRTPTSPVLFPVCSPLFPLSLPSMTILSLLPAFIWSYISWSVWQ